MLRTLWGPLATVAHRYLAITHGLCLATVDVWAQLPEQDCVNAIPVCQNTYVQTVSYYQEGNMIELTYPANTSCLMGGEENSVWYIFTVTVAGNLEMQITPVSPFDDYDWAIYNLTGTDCSSILNGTAPEVRCNYSAIPGSTGMSFPNTLVSVGAGGPNQCAPLPVLEGETYVLLINNHANTFLGYTLHFYGTAVIYDTVRPKPVSLDTFDCDPPAVLHLTLSEYIRCSSLAADGSDFYITGPSSVVVASASAPDCANSAFFNEVDIYLTTPITVNGDYELHFKNDNINFNTLLDNCGNALAFSEYVPFRVALAKANFDYSIVKTCSGDSVYFTNLSTGDSVIHFFWDMSGTTATTQNASAFFPQTGSYSISLVITDTAGCTDDTTLTVHTLTIEPVANFSVSPPPYCLNDTLYLTDGSSGILVAYDWNFGGVGSSSQQNPYFVIQGTNPFDVQLTVTDYIGCTDDTVITITPIEPLQADFTVSPMYLCVGDPVYFSDESLGNPTAFLWQGTGVDGATTPNVNTSYLVEGAYDISLIIFNNLCKPDTAKKTIHVYAYPEVNLGNDTAICVDETLLIQTGWPDLFHEWHTGNHGASYLVTEVPQLVWVRVDNHGCSRRDTIFVDSACPFFIPNAFTPNGDGINDEFRIITDGNQRFLFQIFNRWGQLIFQTTDPSVGWDGTYKGQPQEIGVYVYQLETQFSNGISKIRSGNITLIR